MRVKFWGVRGSIPAPIQPQDIEDKIIRALVGAKDMSLSSHEEVVRYVQNLPYLQRSTTGGNTSCVEVTGDHSEIILDAGSGIRQLGMELMRGPCGQGRGVIHLLMSHTHWDHIMGFPFFMPAYIPGNRIIIYARHPQIEERFRNQHHPNHFPVALETMSAHIEFVSLKSDSLFTNGEFNISTIALRHPGGSYAYKIEKDGRAFIYATDGEYKDLSEAKLQRYLEFFAKGQALVFDAQFTLEDATEKEGWGHSSSFVGVDIALRAAIKELILFHHEPSYNDDKLQEIYDKTLHYYQKVRQGRTLNIIMAREGLELTI
ncbi:MAG: MBL fold metallo-hydrolase [Deltaproteobacteria bacterium]|nr:MBL fold metallo-hydrolase [Deltaproteobacteria bacterium]MBW2070179.1 MBL fold metallo-hydrolase [Deltaproteobacteria bacterium]